jgi:UDP-N-acetylglucosamine acyltransferase
MVGGKSKIVQDVLPFFTTDGNPPRLRGLNSVGLRRAGFQKARASVEGCVPNAYSIRIPIEEALKKLEQIDDEKLSQLIAFIPASKRGFTR